MFGASPHSPSGAARPLGLRFFAVLYTVVELTSDGRLRASSGRGAEAIYDSDAFEHFVAEPEIEADPSSQSLVMGDVETVTGRLAGLR
jgi:hypothetical protein